LTFLRSSIFLALLSLFVLTAYGSEVLDDCCHEAQQERAQKGEHGHGGAPASGADGCQCSCHTGFAAPVVVGLGAPAVERAATERFVIRDEIPPETVPLGIEYPPQLA
jgi:hypothetical protein